MKTLLVLRHAKASHDESVRSDHERPLTTKGRKAARLIGELLRTHELLPDLVLASTAERARDTAVHVVDSAGLGGKVITLDELYLAEPPAYLDTLRRFGAAANRVLVVGHNPGIEALIFRLTGKTEHMPTAALAVCTLAIEEWSELGVETSGELREVFRPKELD